MRTVRIGLAYRAVVLHPERGDVYVLAWVDHHDEAMDWAKNKVFEVNPVTGALQVLDAVVVETLTAPQVAGQKKRALEDFGPFDVFGDADFLRAAREVARLSSSQPGGAGEARFQRPSARTRRRGHREDRRGDASGAPFGR